MDDAAVGVPLIVLGLLMVAFRHWCADNFPSPFWRSEQVNRIAAVVVGIVLIIAGVAVMVA